MKELVEDLKIANVNLYCANKMLEKEIERLKTELQDTKEHLGEFLHEQEEENKRLNNIIKYLKKYFYEHEEYEMTILMHQLENSNIEWFERALREDSDKD